MRITALARGGLAVYGGQYDPHRSEAIALMRDGETVAVTIVYPGAPTDTSATGSGVTVTDPVISGNELTLTLSAVADAGRADVLATVDGAIHKTVIRARSQNPTDRYECGPDYIGA